MESLEAIKDLVSGAQLFSYEALIPKNQHVYLTRGSFFAKAPNSCNYVDDKRYTDQSNDLQFLQKHVFELFSFSIKRVAR